jgi:hypothetical protein
MTSLNVPSSNGVSYASIRDLFVPIAQYRRVHTAGPMMTAFHVMTLSGTGDAETPEGGSVWMRWVCVSSLSRILK